VKSGCLQKPVFLIIKNFRLRRSKVIVIKNLPVFLLTEAKLWQDKVPHSLNLLKNKHVLQEKCAKWMKTCGKTLTL